MANETQDQAPQASQDVNYTYDDMYAMGMNEEEIQTALAKQTDKSKTAESQGTDKNKDEEKPKEQDKAKELEDKKAAEIEEQKKKDVLKDMLFTKEREAKLKANEEAIKAAREVQRSKMTPEQIAAENAELETARETSRLKDVELFTMKQNNAFEALKNSMTPEEWSVIAPDIKAFIDSEAYDLAINDPKVNAETLTADIVAKAKGANFDKLFEVRMKKLEADKAAQKKIEDLQNFGSGHEKPDKTKPPSELEFLINKALTDGRNMTSYETERMIELENQAEEAAKKRR